MSFPISDLDASRFKKFVSLYGGGSAAITTLPSGSVTEPSIGFLQSPTSGMYFNGFIDSVVLTTNAVNVFTVNDTLSSFLAPIQFGFSTFFRQGDISNLSWQFNLTTSGVYYNNAIHFVYEGNDKMSIDNNGVWPSKIIFPNNTTSFSFDSVPDAEMLYINNAFTFINGSHTLEIKNNSLTTTHKFAASNGSLSAPSYTFSSDTTKGLSLVSNTININANTVNTSGVYAVNNVKVIDERQPAILDVTEYDIGTNTGTATVSYSAIGDTTLSDQSVAIMNDFATTLTAIAEIRVAVNSIVTALRTHGLIEGGSGPTPFLPFPDAGLGDYYEFKSSIDLLKSSASVTPTDIELASGGIILPLYMASYSDGSITMNNLIDTLLSDVLTYPVINPNYLTSIITGCNAFTISTWVFSNPSFNSNILTIGDNAFTWYLAFGVFTNAFLVYCIMPSGTVCSTYTLTPNTWNHIALSIDATGNYMYVNGVLVTPSYFIGDGTIPFSQSVNPPLNIFEILGDGLYSKLFFSSTFYTPLMIQQVYNHQINT